MIQSQVSDKEVDQVIIRDALYTQAQNTVHVPGNQFENQVWTSTFKDGPHWSPNILRTTYYKKDIIPATYLINTQYKLDTSGGDSVLDSLFIDSLYVRVLNINLPLSLRTLNQTLDGLTYQATINATDIWPQIEAYLFVAPEITPDPLPNATQDYIETITGEQQGAVLLASTSVPTSGVPSTSAGVLSVGSFIVPRDWEVILVIKSVADGAFIQDLDTDLLVDIEQRVLITSQASISFIGEPNEIMKE